MDSNYVSFVIGAVTGGALVLIAVALTFWMDRRR